MDWSACWKNPTWKVRNQSTASNTTHASALSRAVRGRIVIASRLPAPGGLALALRGVRLELARHPARDAHLGRLAGPPHVRVVLDVLWRGDVHVHAGGQLVPMRLVEQLLVARRPVRAPFDVQIVRS